MIELKDKLLEKSQEAFIMGIEIYNKPTIKYRVEGFSFFICNAWELMLKSHMINKFGENSIYYPDSKDRTLSLEACIKRIFTNKKDPLRINLEKIIDLRNTSTHFITEEYEQIYVPLFQSCVLNYSNKLLDFFDFDVTVLIPQNFLTLSININELTEESIKARYSEEIAEKLIKTSNSIKDISGENNAKFSISIVHDYYITKDKKTSSAKIKIISDAENAAFILRELKDPKDTHKYSTTEIVDLINKKVLAKKIGFKSLSTDKSKEREFNRFHFNLFVNFYNLKDDDKYCYIHEVNNQKTPTYSQATFELILSEIKKDPENIIQNLKNRLKK